MQQPTRSKKSLITYTSRNKVGLGIVRADESFLSRRKNKDVSSDESTY